MMKKITLFILALCFSKTVFLQNALDFDGTNDVVLTTAPAITGNTAKSVEAWIKTTATTISAQKVIVDFGQFATGQRFTLNLLWSNAVRLEVSGSGVSDTTVVNDGVWHHVAAVYDPLAVYKVKLYVDGIKKTEGNLTVSVNTSGVNAIRIGERIDGTNRFDGSIDEVRVWDIALTDAQVLNNYNTEFCSPYPTGLHAYFKCNAGVAGGSNPGVTTLYEEISGNHGTLSSFSLSGSSSNWVSGYLPTLNSFDTLSATQCTPYTSPSGKVWGASGTYYDTLPNSLGCDSLFTIYLTVPVEDTVISEITCGSYISPSGAEYFSSGTYLDTLPTVSGCDSIITINLTIPIEDTTIVETDCDSYVSPSGTIYDVTGTYYDTLATTSGCDSVITIDLTIVDIDTSITVTGATLTANLSGAEYQWLNCDNGAAFIGADEQSFSPENPGNYNVAITYDGCTVFSSCFFIDPTSINELDKKAISISPNPVSDFLNITYNQSFNGGKISVYGMDGKMFQQFEINEGIHQQTLDLRKLDSGIHLITIEVDEHKWWGRFVKE